MRYNGRGRRSPVADAGNLDNSATLPRLHAWEHDAHGIGQCGKVHPNGVAIAVDARRLERLTDSSAIDQRVDR